MALAQSRAIGAEDHRDMGKTGEGIPEGLEQENLPRRISDVIVSPYDVGNTHGPIIHHHGEVIGGHAIAPLNDQIIQLRIFEDDPPFDQILHHRLSFLRT